VSSPESSGAGDAADRARALSDALRAAALFDGEVEAAGALAVLVPRRGDEPAPARERRLEIARVARAHGFTHVALEVAPVSDLAARRPVGD